MNDYELLLEEISQELPVIETDLTPINWSGGYMNGVIFIESHLPFSKKRELLTEEYAHFKTSSTNIINLHNPLSRKEELKARRYSYEMLISLDDLIKCSEANLVTPYECADYLNVSVNTLKATMKHYYQKYGPTHFYKGRIFQFNENSVLVLNTGLNEIS